MLIVNEGLKEILKRLQSAGLAFKIRAMKAAIAPLNAATVWAGISADECDFVGYAALDQSVMPAPAIIAGPAAESASAALAFTAGALTGAQTCYAIVVTFEDAGAVTRLYAAENLAEPQSVAIPGEKITFKLTDRTAPG